MISDCTTGWGCATAAAAGPTPWSIPIWPLRTCGKRFASLAPDRGRFRAAVVDQLGNTLCHSGSTPRAVALRAAIECHIEAAEIYQSLGMADDWGRTQFNLGNSCCDLSEITGEDHWQEAVFHYEESLRVRTREKDPERHAAVLENLGSAYRRLSGGGTGDNVKKASGATSAH